MLSRNYYLGLLAVPLLMAAPMHVAAVSMTVDEVIFEDGTGVNSSLMTGTVDMTLSGSLLTIVLTNTSAAGAAPAGSGAILSGLGFNFPTGILIGSGSVALTTGSVGVNWSGGTGGTDVSGEWGYDNPELDSGPFNNAGIIQSTVNTAITSMVASTTDPFSGVPLFNPGVLAGPEMGLISEFGDAGGQLAIRDSVTILVNLSGTGSLTGLLDHIQNNAVVLSFGSPDSSTLAPPPPPPPEPPNEVDEPVTLGMLVLGLAALGMRRRAKKTV